MMRTRLLLAALVLLSLCRIAEAQPSLGYAVPAAARPGQSVEVTLHGAKLSGPLQAWSSFPARLEIVGDAKDDKSVQCKITLDDSAAVGIGGLIVGSAAGASDALLLMVDDLPSIADNDKNHSAGEAQELSLPAAVDGASNGASFDYYKFTAQAGQRVAVEVVAARLGSNFDAVVRLLDSTGKELVLADDDASLGADCRFAHKIEADGQYVLEVRDNRYQGGQRYRLRVGDFPLVTTPYPLGARRGSTPRIGFTGPAGDSPIAVLVDVPDFVAGGRLPVSARFPDGKSSALAVLATSALPEEIEAEPNDDAKVATPITLPCAVSGRFAARGDRDYYGFPAKKGQRFTFAAASRSLGSPSFVYMQLFNEGGGKVAETSVGDADELTMAYTIAADGVYRLMAEDLNRAGGPGYGYRIEIRRGGDFSLSLKNDKNTKTKFAPAHAGGAFSLDVQCARNGYDGPITLQLEDPSAGLRLLNPVIPSKAKAHKLIVAPAMGAKPGDLSVMRIFGRGEADGREISALLSTLAYVRTKIPQSPYPPAWFDGLITVSTKGAAGGFFDTKLDQPAVFFPRQLGTASLSAALVRQNKEFKDPITVLADDLPHGIILAAKADKDNYALTLSGPKNLPAGRHTFEIVGYGEFKGAGQLVTKRVTLEIGSPLSVTAAPAGPLAPGQKQKVKIAIARQGADKQPVKITWAKLPPGVTAEKEYTITADAAEIEVELTASADAKPQTYSDLTVQAVTQYTGQQISVQSSPVSLEVKKAG